MMTIAELHKVYLSSTGVTTDTRNIQPGSIFFALKGDKFNANLFANDAIDSGAAYAVVDEVIDNSDKHQNKLILVKDVLTTLQELAGYHRRQLECPVLAITGSNGKTTTKELIGAVLSKKYKTVATKGNLNNHIGVPLTILSTPLDAEFLIVEMGANHQLEIAGYCVYADPDYGLITNIGKAHLEGFGGEEGVIKGKTELYTHIGRKGGKLFVSSGSKILSDRALIYVSSDRIVNYGSKAGDFCSGLPLQSGEFLSIRISDDVVIPTNLVGQYNFDNVMAAICIGRYFDVSMTDIRHAIEEYVPSNNRSQKVTRGTNTILLDAYNANPSSMVEALKNFDQLDAENKITILGEMMELGEYSEIEHLKIIDIVEGMDLAQRVFVGDGFHMLKGKENVLYFENTELLKAWYQSQHFEHMTQLIKGSRKNGLERILA
ncbi:MAG: UDP-N-acetylmuramoylalanyl-D-glutamyl-2,6-diaminopimelate-D-alanyl-D-alanine ligase [Bacteroidetes bacterium]|nr:UDP-N-acetylmuramoylalanyl-D-glutamyl-2,6-diaminopimelate-D-alanyl-D-alanine ligase [Bacteroidota bacterium]